MGPGYQVFWTLICKGNNNIKNQHSLIPSNDTKYRLPFEVAVYLIKPGLSKVKSCNVPATSTNPGQHNLLVLG